MNKNIILKQEILDILIMIIFCTLRAKKDIIRYAGINVHPKIIEKNHNRNLKMLKIVLLLVLKIKNLANL